SRRHSCSLLTVPSCFFFPVPPPAALHSLSLHDALPICLAVGAGDVDRPVGALRGAEQIDQLRDPIDRRGDLVFRGAGDDLLIDLPLPQCDLLSGLGLGMPLALTGAVEGPTTGAAHCCHALSLCSSTSTVWFGSFAAASSSTRTEVARVSAAMKSLRSATAWDQFPGTARERLIRSVTCRPAALRASCTWRTTSRAYPSPRSSSSSSRSSTAKPPVSSTPAARVSPKRSSISV